MNNDPLQQLLGVLHEISWQLHEINRKLDTLQLPAASAAPAAPAAEDPKAEAVRWIQAHFISKQEGDLDHFLARLPLFHRADDLDAFLFPYCLNGNIRLRDFCTTVCATHLLALIKTDRKNKTEQFRRTVSSGLRYRYEMHCSRVSRQEQSASN